jgi:hypothetical protein
MAITKKAAKPVQTIDKIEAFISGAPDSKGKAEPATGKQIKMIGNKAIVSLSISPETLARLDAWAKANDVSRSAAITKAVKLLK